MRRVLRVLVVVLCLSVIWPVPVLAQAEAKSGYFYLNVGSCEGLTVLLDNREAIPGPYRNTFEVASRAFLTVTLSSRSPCLPMTRLIGPPPTYLIYGLSYGIPINPGDVVDFELDGISIKPATFTPFNPTFRTYYV